MIEISEQNINTKNMKHEYDYNFHPSEEYLMSMPDIQDGCNIKGSKVDIERVGISNFRLPIKFKTKNGEIYELEASIIGTVSLEGVNKGINMSRIIRTFYEYRDEVFTIDLIEKILKDYREKLGSYSAHIQISFNYRMWQNSLRSTKNNKLPNGGWQYYKVTLEGLMKENGKFNKYIHFDYVYSSTCPCSTELSLHALETRNQYATPHSQRSVARISLKLKDFIWIEDIQDMCLKALKTETQVFVKREDEQAFAELNAANTKFVEDAVRLLYEQFNSDDRIIDFKIIASHNESLHSHDAIAVITKGIEHGFNKHISIADVKSLIY
jgi:GTP cyclohydrolase I